MKMSAQYVSDPVLSIIITYIKASINSHSKILNGMGATVIPTGRQENGGTSNEISFLKAREEAQSRFRLRPRRPHSNSMLLL